MRGLGWSWCLLVVVSVANGCAYSASKGVSGWLMVETEHIQLRTNVSSKRAIELASELQGIRDGLAGFLLKCGSQGDADRLPVTVLPRSAFTDFVPAGSEGAYRAWPVTWLGGYEGQILVPEELSLLATQVFQHELMHHLVANCLPRAPRWLNEGLASFAETAIVERGRVRLGIPPYVLLRTRAARESALYKGIRVTVMSLLELPSIERILAIPDDQFWTSHEMSRTTENYAASWAMVHLLENGAVDLRPRFAAYLAALRRSDKEPSALFAEHFREVPLQERLTRYLVAGQFPYNEGPVRLPRRLAPRAHPMSAGDTHLHLAWLWFGADHDADARGRALEHLAEAKRDATSRPRAHVLAASELAFTDRADQAEREVSQGLRTAPNHPELLHAHMELLLHRKQDASAAARRLRPVARTANQLCALARLAFAHGDAGTARALAIRGLKMKPSARACRDFRLVVRSAAGS